jgi:hypothetical protein
MYQSRATFHLPLFLSDRTFSHKYRDTISHDINDTVPHDDMDTPSHKSNHTS